MPQFEIAGYGGESRSISCITTSPESTRRSELRQRWPLVSQIMRGRWKTSPCWQTRPTFQRSAAHIRNERLYEKVADSDGSHSRGDHGVIVRGLCGDGDQSQHILDCYGHSHAFRHLSSDTRNLAFLVARSCSQWGAIWGNRIRRR